MEAFMVKAAKTTAGCYKTTKSSRSATGGSALYLQGSYDTKYLCTSQKVKIK